jgi:hypothetical protein
MPSFWLWCREVLANVQQPNQVHLHGSMFGLSRHDLSLIHYTGMAFVKLCVFLFFFPWLAVRLVLGKAKA